MYQNNYQPHTNLIFHSIEELRDLLYGQEVTLPYQYHVRKEIRAIPIFYPNDQKQEKIKHLIQYQAQIPFSINVTKECLNSLKILSENKTKENETNALLQELNQKETIDEEDISFLASLLNKDLFSFVDRLWSQPLINEESYYQNVSEKQKLIQELEETKQKLLEMQKREQTLLQENEQLKQTNEQAKQMKKQLESVLTTYTF